MSICVYPCVRACVRACVRTRVYLGGVQGVGEHSADGPVPRRETGVVSAVLVFVGHLRGTWGSRANRGPRTVR